MIQAELDATQAKLQTNLEVKSHVTRAQFDEELKVYRQLWNVLAKLKLATWRLILGLEDYEVERNEDAPLNSLFGDFAKAGKEFSEVDEQNRPFYGETVDDSLEPLRKLFRVKADIYRGWNNNESSFSTADNNAAITMSAIDKVREAIRARFAEMVVIE